MSTEGDCFTEVDVLYGPANTYLFYEDLRGLHKKANVSLRFLFPDVRIYTFQVFP